MSPRTDEAELRRRAIEGVREEVEAFGGGDSRSRLIRRGGLIASVTPAAPQRSLLNSVYYDDPAALREEVEPGPIDASACAELNDRAYGYGPDGFRAGLARETTIGWRGAFEGGRAVGCVGAIEVGDDCCITGVATPPDQRGRGIASWLLRRVLGEARKRGLTTASLQATRAGASLYERLGFRDFGFVEMWELRR